MGERSPSANDFVYFCRKIMWTAGCENKLKIALQPVLVRRLNSKPCDCSAQLQGVPGPPGPKCQKSPKKVAPGLSARSAKKVPKKSKKSRKSLSLALFRDFFDFFSTFLALWADRPWATFLGLFRHFGPGGPGTPCNWALQSQSKP